MNLNNNCTTPNHPSRTNKTLSFRLFACLKTIDQSNHTIGSAPSTYSNNTMTHYKRTVIVSRSTRSCGPPFVCLFLHPSTSQTPALWWLTSRSISWSRLVVKTVAKNREKNRGGRVEQDGGVYCVQWWPTTFRRCQLFVFDAQNDDVCSHFSDAISTMRKFLCGEVWAVRLICMDFF